MVTVRILTRFRLRIRRVSGKMRILIRVGRTNFLLVMTDMIVGQNAPPSHCFLISRSNLKKRMLK